jgi:hypothetical protein
MFQMMISFKLTLLAVCFNYLLCRAAEMMSRAGQLVTLKVAKHAAVYHGLAQLLNVSTPLATQGKFKFL